MPCTRWLAAPAVAASFFRTGSADIHPSLPNPRDGASTKLPACTNSDNRIRQTVDTIKVPSVNRDDFSRSTKNHERGAWRLCASGQSEASAVFASDGWR
jgi:hypothetical protein